MATEGGTDLRERLAVALYDAQWEGAGFSFAGEVERAFTRQLVDAILGAIAESGMVIVERDRLTQLQHVAEWVKHTPVIPPDVCRPVVLMPGDLDREAGRG